MKSGMILYIDGTDTANLQSPFCFTCTTWPEVTQTGGFLAAFTYVAWVKSNRVMTASVFKNKFFVEPHKIKRLLELVTEALLIVIAITFKRSEERRVGKECRTRWGRDH